MSSDVYVRCHTCGSTLNERTNLPAGLGQLFRDLDTPVYDWHNKVGVDVLPQLTAAIRALTNDTEYWRGQAGHAGEWDRVDFAIPFLISLRDAICQEPHAVVTVS